MTKARRTNIYFLGLIIFYIIGCFYLIPLIPESWLDENSSVILGQSLIIIPTLIYLICTKFRPVKDIPFKKIKITNVLLLIVLTYLLIPLITFINAFSMLFADNKIAATMDGMNTNPLWLNLVLMGLLPAFVEEFVFRGLIYGGYRNSVIKRAMLSSALLFGIFHMNINQLMYAFVMGIIFVLLREGTGSIFASMIVHCVFNSNSVILVKLQQIIQKAANKMANSDDSSVRATASKLKRQFDESGSSKSLYSGMSLGEVLSLLISLLMVAVVATTLAILLYIFIIKRCNRKEHVKHIVYSIFNKSPKQGNYVMNENEYIEQNTEEYGGRIIDPVFILGLVLCIMMMVLAMI